MNLPAWLSARYENGKAQKLHDESELDDNDVWGLAYEQELIDAVRLLLRHIGEDPEREGLKDTPIRVLRSYSEMFYGYRYSDEQIASVLTCFEDGACDEMVLLKDIDFHSFCEHHMLPFTGVCHVAYLPKGRVVGVSKLARIVDIYAARLQIQERLTQQITTALDRHLQPRGSACVIESSHACMQCRGVKKSQAKMVTSSITGDFRDSGARQEFLNLVLGR